MTRGGYTVSMAIPGPSQVQPGNVLRRIDMSQCGILNDSNNCALLSIILCLHDMRLVGSLVQPANITKNNAPDYAILVLRQVLLALPNARAFSLQIFLDSWNDSCVTDQNRAVIGQHEDLLIFDNIMKAVICHLQPTNTPLLTQFRAQFYCAPCQQQFSNVSQDSYGAFAVIPLVSLPRDQPSVTPGDLLTDLLQSHIDVTCPQCGVMCHGNFDVTKGAYTIMVINRRGYQDQQGNYIPLLRTRLTDRRGINVGSGLLGTLVSVVSHRGDVRTGHWVSYHLAQDTNTWYINDDSQPLAPSNCHPFVGQVANETADLLVFKN